MPGNEVKSLVKLSGKKKGCQIWEKLNFGFPVRNNGYGLDDRIKKQRVGILAVLCVKFFQ